MKTFNLYLLLLLPLLCYAKGTKNDINDFYLKGTKMKKIDKALYDSVVDKDKRIILEDGTRLRYTSHGPDAYMEEIESPDYPIRIQNLYYSDTETLKQSTQIFGNMGIGIRREYDKQGNIIKEEDLDKPFPFSIEDLRRLLIKKCDIDIYDKSLNLFLTRSHFTDPPCYLIKIYTEPRMPYRRLEINAINGSVLLDTIITPESDHLD